MKNMQTKIVTLKRNVFIITQLKIELEGCLEFLYNNSTFAELYFSCQLVF